MNEYDVDVLLLSTYDTDGAGKFADSLTQALADIGYSTQTICLRRRSNKENTVGLLDGRPLRQLSVRLLEEFDRRIISPKKDFAFIHLRHLSKKFVLGATCLPKQCKLIICTFLSGMIDLPTLVKLKLDCGNPPVIFYPVDMNLFTGGCHYAQSCNGYLADCTTCPAVPAILHNHIMQEFARKKLAYQQLKDSTVIVSSSELEEQILQSSALKNFNLRKILMGVDEKLFGKYEEQRFSFRKELNCKKTVFLIRSSSEPRKGCESFINAIHDLQQVGSNLLDDLTILTVGDDYIFDNLHGAQCDIRSYGYVSKTDELAKLYAIADVFLMTSTADSGPVMLAQSLMSGTPVISTNVGMARDVVHSPFGGDIIFEPFESTLKDSICSFLLNPSRTDMNVRRKVRKMAVEQMSRHVYLERLSVLVDELL